MFATAFTAVRQRLGSRPVEELLVQEVLGINTPKVIFTRSREERADVFINEFGNTAGFFGLGWGMDAGLNALYRNTPKSMAPWSAMGRFFGMASLLGAVMWGMPFLRNLVTAYRTGKVDYTDVIGAHRKATPTQESVLFKQKTREYRNALLGVLGVGSAGALLSIGTSLAMIRRKAPLGKAADWLHRQLNRQGVTSGRFLEFGKEMPSLLFWGTPAYLGWIHAARDPYERKEQLLKFANFLFCFYGPKPVLRRLLQRIPDGRAIPLLGTGKNLKYFAPIVTAILMLGTLPTLLNIRLTTRRLARDAAQARQVALSANLPAGGGVRPESFDQFLSRLQRRYNASGHPPTSRMIQRGDLHVP